MRTTRTLPAAVGALAVAAAALVGFAAPAAADTLLIDRVAREGAVTEPTRGMDMDAVLARYGEPATRFDPVGGNKPQHPPITKWAYPQFTVYFEHDKVIDVVVNRSTVFEQGPKPADQ
jgi:hypothetical protein